jgi:glycosyltransferase involved in cell wall biosynthesis
VQAFRGLEELVLAFRRIDGAELVISGYGPIEQRLIRLAASEGIAERVHFTGRYSPSDALSIVAGCDIGVLPFDAVTKSIEYSSPNKLFDYAMGGLAVAATSLPFIRQFIEENDAGRTFSRNDPDEIAATINEMAADTERLTEYRHNARTAAYDRFHWDKQFSENYPWMPETDSLP